MSRLAAFLGQAGQEYRQMRLGLQRMSEALERLNHPEKAFASVLIAGTNGKGSTARMVESVLRRAGHRSGLYTSPHLLRFNERILIAGEEAPGELLEAILEDWSRAGLLDAEGNWPAAGERLTWFELATLLAFEAFRRSRVEIAVLEVGLGGKMDATNVVEPLVSAVTSIGMDHAEVLGSSLEAIAREKAGVLRPGRPVVLGSVSAEIAALFRKWIQEVGGNMVQTKPALGSPQGFSYGPYRHLSIPLEGRHQLANAAVAIELLLALKEDGYFWDEGSLREGLASANHPGRLQWLPGKPPLLLDGAHNPQAWTALAEYLREKRGDKKSVFLLAAMKEKDPVAALEILEPMAQEFLFTEIANSRCLPLQAWRELAEKRKLKADFSAKPQAALELARKRAGPGGLVVVTGSLYLVAEILAS